MSGKRFEGKNLEEAIDSAAKSFGVESFRVSYHVVLEKRGFLGGTKRVVIEADVSGPAPKPEKRQPEKQPRREERETKAEKPQKSERPRQEQSPRRGDKPKRKSGDRPRPAAAVADTADHGSDNWVLTDHQPRSERSEPARQQEDGESDSPQERGGRNNRRRGRRGRGGKGREGAANGSEQDSSDRARDQVPAPPAPVVPVVVPEQGSQSEDAAKVASWCEEIFRLSGLDLVVRTTDRDEEISVELFGSDLGTIEEAGDYLDSLQVLANKAFTGRSVERPIELDAGGFKQRREEELAQRAREMADRVREEGRERTMRAMSPIERRIVHLALEQDSRVTTESRGRGFHKRVAILPAEEEQSLSGES